MNYQPRIRGTTPEIEEAARRLRKNLTPAEARLWSALRGKQLAGLRFRCQHPVGNFILDFYCASCKLVVEVDGEIHDQQIDYDHERTSTLAEYGYTVLRFSNEQVFNNFFQVLSEIRQVAISLFPPSCEKDSPP
ncbi:MAG: endonuclease domain-containing protein [Waterburya sp.]